MWLLLIAVAAVPAPITAVTIYDGQARVVRTASLVLAGRQTVELPALPATADPASVRVDAEGAEVQSIELQSLGSEGDPRTLALERLDRAIASAEREQKLLEQLAGVAGWKPEPAGAGPLPAVTPDPRGWRRGLDFLARFADRMDGQRRALDRRLNELRAERALHASTPEAGRHRPRLQVLATVTGTGPARLHLRYLVPGASWQPSYELRLDPGRERVVLSLSGIVSQTSGEDWPGARLTFSTARPAALGTPPRLTAWRIGDSDRFVPAAVPLSAPVRSPPSPAWSVRVPAGTVRGYVYDEAGRPLVGVKVVIAAGPGTSARVYTDPEGRFAFSGLQPGSYDLTASAPRLSPVTQRGLKLAAGQGLETTLILEVETGVEEVTVVERAPLVNVASPQVKQAFDHGSMAPSPAPRRRRTLALAPPAVADPPPPEVSFPALLPDSIGSGESPRRVPLRSWALPVKVQRALYPALQPAAYLLAQMRAPIEDGLEPRLPPGEVALFVGDDPAGTAELQPLAPGQTIDLPAGLDRDLRAVRRVTVATRHEGLVRKQEISRHTVTVAIGNPHSVPVRLALHDQVPIAADERVESRLVASTPAASWDRETGALRWQLEVRPGQTARVSFSYELRHRKGLVVRQGGTP